MHQLTWIEIDQKALLKNINLLSHSTTPSKLMFVLKGNAYGHGLLEVATILHRHFPHNYLCVAYTSEAVVLRNAGIINPLLALVHYEKNYEATIEYNITLTIYEKADLYELEKKAKSARKPVSVHLKIDTGMSRLGINAQEAYEIIKTYLNHPFIHIEGIYTHIFNKDTYETNALSHQLMLFNAAIEKIAALTNKPLITHALSSSTLPMRSDFHYTHARVGSHLYGLEFLHQFSKELYPSPLQPVMTWKTRIISIKTIAPGTCVGYGCTFKASRSMKIATLALGYSDGYPRQLSHKANVFLHNTLLPVLGIISMNLITIDISHIPQAALYDEAIVLGNHAGVKAEEIAQKLNTIPLEITSHINPKIPRLLV